MRFIKSINAAASAVVLSSSAPKDLQVNDTNSIQAVAKTLAAGAMSYYQGNSQTYVDLPSPYYWWECGALFGAMLDYSHYTSDSSYDETIATALLNQVGPNYDYMLPKHYGDEGNDDLGFWGLAVMQAAESNFPQPNATIPAWLELGQNIWNTLVSRWNTTTCGGGLPWQIFASNPNGIHYKNSISNGGFLQLSARLYRATGNQTYLQWAETVWDWSQNIGLITSDWQVLDGVDSNDNCSTPNQLSFSYSLGTYLYGTAVLANATNGNQTWMDRTNGLMTGTQTFFSPFSNATNIMYEHACEQVDLCNTDMRSFKGYLSRFMFKSAIMVPSLASTVNDYLLTTAQAAAGACTGGTNNTSCGEKWYVGGFDGNTGLGQDMCALETIQGLLALNSTAPYKGDQIQIVRTFGVSSSLSSSASSASSSS